MPTFFKAIFYLLAELFLIAAAGCIGAWLPVRNIPAGEWGPGDGFGMVVFGEIGMFVGGMLGVLGLVIFWSAMEIRATKITEFAKKNVVNPQDETVWPPAPGA